VGDTVKTEDIERLEEALEDVNRVLGNTQIRADQIALTAARNKIRDTLDAHKIVGEVPAL
jgi:hypothetical protein